MNKEITKFLGKLLNLFYMIRGFIKGCLPNVYLKKRIRCESNVVLHTFFGGRIFIGNDCYLGSGCKLITSGGDIKIGHHCSINPYAMLYGHGGLTIGNYVRIATQCVLIPSNHNFSDANIPIADQGITNKGIVIEDDVWLGSGVKVLDGVTISKGCIIGAGSVVTKSTVSNGIYAGVPAKLIKMRG